jgi:hypothetical protein
VDEVFTLESACRTADTIVRLDAALEGQPLTVAGSMGQLREHPLLAEARQQRSLLGRLLTQLKLPEVGEIGTGTAGERSVKARSAALTRWRTT